jgi:signal transduction histidine kinase
MIVQQLGGDIKVMSELGKGSEFLFTIQLDETSEIDSNLANRILNP